MNSVATIVRRSATAETAVLAFSWNDDIDWGSADVPPAVFGVRPKTSPAGQANLLVSDFLPAIQSAGRRLVRQLEPDKYCPHLAG
jgi:hypothetical protein